jgi:hypothetical protein
MAIVAHESEETTERTKSKIYLGIGGSAPADLHLAVGGHLHLVVPTAGVDAHHALHRLVAVA